MDAQHPSRPARWNRKMLRGGVAGWLTLWIVEAFACGWGYELPPVNVATLEATAFSSLIIGVIVGAVVTGVVDGFRERPPPPPGPSRP